MYLCTVSLADECVGNGYVWYVGKLLPCCHLTSKKAAVLNKTGELYADYIRYTPMLQILPFWDIAQLDVP